MRSRIKRSRRRPKEEARTSVVEYKAEANSPLNRILEKGSLKEVPMEERQKEAKKPLFLLRYE